MKFASTDLYCGRQVKGRVTYNGHTLDEFVPQKTAVYISQNDLHTAQMTVRETLDFSARCQGTGSRYGNNWFSNHALTHIMI